MEMTICPECRHILVVPPQYLGKWWRCPDCRTGFAPRVARADLAAPAPEAQGGGLFGRLRKLIRG